MEERTIIPQQDSDILYIQLAKCDVYEDAQKLLNTFVLDFINEHGGEIYNDGFDLDENFNKVILQYKKSKYPKDVKCAVFDALIREIDKCEVLNKEVLGRLDEKTLKKDWKYVTMLRQREKDTCRVRRWVEAWQKEAPPKIMKKEYRFRPKYNSVKENIHNLFNYYVSIGNLDNESKERWDYLCGVSDSIKTKKPINWHGEWTSLCAIIEYFLLNKTYFAFDRGVTKYFLCDNMFINDDGTILNESLLANLKTQSKKYCSLDREKGYLQKVLQHTLSTK